MTFRTNQKVTTPLGAGIIQGRAEQGWIVRLPVNIITKPSLNVSITPRAKFSGLWIFKESELK